VHEPRHFPGIQDGSTKTRYYDMQGDLVPMMTSFVDLMFYHY
jgi:hypothetical protein